MAEPIKVPDENSPFEEKIAYLRSQNIPEDTIAKHFSQVNDPNAQAWVRQYKIGQAQTAANQAMGPTSNASSPAPGSLDTSGIQSLNKVANKFTNWYANLSTPEQIAYPIGTILGTYAGGKAINYAYDTLKDKRQADIEVKKQAALNALPPSAAVQVQQQQLALQQAEQANRFAQQAAGVNAGPVYDPLLDARVQTETQRTASEAARTKIAEAQAQLAQEKLIQTQRKAAMVKANPAGAAAQVAAAEGLPVDAQITTGAQPSAAQLAETHGINLPTAQGSVTPPTNVEPVPVSPANATPAVPETPTTTAEVVTDPNATPVEKAVTLTQEAPPAVETPKVAGAAEPVYNERVQKAIASVPPNVQEQFAKQGKVALGGYGAGDISITNTYGPDAYQKIIDHFNNGQPVGSDDNYKLLRKKIAGGVPPSMATDFANVLPGSESEAGNFAKSFGDRFAYTPQGDVVKSPKAMKSAIESGGQSFLAMSPKNAMKGAITPSALATTAVLTALPALGVAAVKKYQGNEAAVNASLQDAKDSLKSLATMPYDVSKAALNGNFAPLKDLMLSMNPGSLLFNEMDKHDEEIIKKMIQKEKVGAGRGMQGVPPPNR